VTPLSVGDTVFVEGWAIDDGFTLTECVVETKAADLLRLRRVKLHRRSGSTDDTGYFESIPESYFATPLRERCARLTAEIQEMVRQFER
jgi:hypothetical protein